MNLEYLYAKLLKKLQGRAITKSIIHRTSKVEAGSHIVCSTFNKHSFCGYNCDIINTDIGSFCSISNNVKIGGGMHPINWVSTSPVFYEGRDSVKKKFSIYKREPNKRTLIEHDVWIGESSIIKQGVRIGTGAVIGMGSIVTKDVEPYSIVAGSPAKEIKKRFNEKIISELLETKWWEFSDYELNKYAIFMQDPDAFITQLKIRI